MGLIGPNAAREAVGQLEALAKQLTERDFEARVTSGDVDAPSLGVFNLALPGPPLAIAAAPADDGVWWFWWSPTEPIARTADVDAAAFKIAYVLAPHVGK